MTIYKFYTNTCADFCEFEASLLDIVNYKPEGYIVRSCLQNVQNMKNIY